MVGGGSVALAVKVPNVPCGVESIWWGAGGSLLKGVPNVPCGVES